MELTSRPFTLDADMAHIDALLAVLPAHIRHVVDAPWRLSSPAIETGRDGRLWSTLDGELVGVAIWQLWWAALDVYVLPGPARAAVEAAIFDWAPARFRELDVARGHPLPYWVEAREDDDERLAFLMRCGYAQVDADRFVSLRRSLAAPIPSPSLPDGFAIRPLAGPDEVAGYVAAHRAAFASTSMTSAWRSRTLQMPRYRPDLDLVAVAPGGDIAGFCIGWLAPDGALAQIEPLGVVPAYRRLGLGQALILELLRRFRACGAAEALVETEEARSTAVRTYEVAGFQTAHRVLRRGRLFAPADEHDASPADPL
jgi:ribosomal protein S18 acetylase RimI-like enzyme